MSGISARALGSVLNARPGGAMAPMIESVTSLVVQLDDDAAERLRRRAHREGVDVTELAQRLLAEASEQDPFEFIGSFNSELLGARDVDPFLEEHAFGHS